MQDIVIPVCYIPWYINKLRDYRIKNLNFKINHDIHLANTV